MAVLYSRVIHSLKKDDEPEPPSQEDIEKLVEENVTTALQASFIMLQQEIVSQIELSLAQPLEERFTMLDMKQAGAMAHLNEEHTRLITETVSRSIEAVFQQRAAASLALASPKIRSITEAASRKRAAIGGPQMIDEVIWPLLNAGLSVRQIAVKADTSTATVGRSRKRWNAAQGISVTDLETSEQAEAAERII